MEKTEKRAIPSETSMRRVGEGKPVRGESNPPLTGVREWMEQKGA